MRMKATMVSAFLLLSTQNIFAYNAVNRFKIIDDKLQTDAMMRSFGHDFLFDINASLNADAKTFISDISDASKLGTVAAAQNVLSKYENTEQTLKLNMNLGVPIFSFSAWDLKVRPNFRVMADAGVNIGVRKDSLSPQDIINISGVSIPTDMQSGLTALWNGVSVGQDIFTTTNCNNAYASGTTARTECYALIGQNIKKPDSSIPNLNLFIKAQAKAGFFNTYEYSEHFFGDFNLYGMYRADGFQIINYAMIQSGQKIDTPKKANTELTAQLDYKLGYKNDNYSVALSAEEIKLAKLKERDAGSKELSYGYDPLLRLHAEANYKLTNLSLVPFAGFHKRSGYALSDGMYGGATVGAHVWGDRLGLMFRGELDKQYVTFNPRIKLWLMQLEYNYKKPLKSTDGDVKLSAIQSIDFRLFF